MKPKLFLKIKDNKTSSLNTPIIHTPLITESELPIMNKFSPMQDRTKVRFNHKLKQVHSKSNSKNILTIPKIQNTNININTNNNNSNKQQEHSNQININIHNININHYNYFPNGINIPKTHQHIIIKKKQDQQQQYQHHHQTQQPVENFPKIIQTNYIYNNTNNKDNDNKKNLLNMKLNKEHHSIKKRIKLVDLQKIKTAETKNKSAHFTIPLTQQNLNSNGSNGNKNDSFVNELSGILAGVDGDKQIIINEYNHDNFSLFDQSAIQGSDEKDYYLDIDAIIKSSRHKNEKMKQQHRMKNTLTLRNRHTSS